MEIIFKKISEKDIKLIAESLYSEVKKFCIQYKKDETKNEIDEKENKE